MPRSQEQLLQALIKDNLLTMQQASDLKKEAKSGGLAIYDLLVAKKLVSEKELLAVRGKLFNLPISELKGVLIPKDVLNLIPQEVAENYQMVAFGKNENDLMVGLVDPQNYKAIEAVEFLAQKADWQLKYFLISDDSFKYAFNQYQMLAEEAKEALEGISEELVLPPKLKAKEGAEMEAVIKRAPVSKMVLVIFKHALAGRASDIHIEPTSKDTKVRYRIDGILKTSLVLPKYVHAAIIARIKVLANLKLDETRRPQDGRIRLNIDNRDVDFRVSTLPLADGEKAVLRILDTASDVPSLVKLGFHPKHIQLVEGNLRRPHGLVLLTGPTGSGKTTTLYTILTMINQESVNIITLEDPIEYYIAGVNQSQINPEIEYSFASGLRAILRQDPNVVMVGEIRDRETTELVVHASLTGHLILSTLHTNDALGAIPRLIDLGAEPFLLSSVMNIIIAQRLARKICSNCKDKVAVPDHLQSRIKQQLSEIPKSYLEELDLNKIIFYQGKGCAQCGNTGYQGRIAALEIIDINAELQEIIKNGAQDQVSIKEALKHQEFITLTQDCLIKALKGLTTLDEVLRISHL